MKKVYLQDYHLLTPAGNGTDKNFQSLLAGESPIRIHDFGESIGHVYASMFEDDILSSLNPEPAKSRIENLANAVLSPLIERHQVSEGSLLILSTTKGNVRALETQNDFSDEVMLPYLAQSLQKNFGFVLEPIIVSNACVSGVLAISTAKRMLQMEACEDVYIIAIDELTKFIISGFQSFKAISKLICKPFDENRDGVTLGEAAASAYLSTKKTKDSIWVAGDANINDANHISGPSRTGEGLFLSIKNALQEAKVDVDEIDFVSAHGTATLYNDDMESIAFQRSHLAEKPTHSLKGFYGHTLGASGLLEAVITAESLKRNQLIKSFGFHTSGTTHPLNIIQDHRNQNLRIALKTSSGFGGTNSAIVMINEK